MINFKIGAEVCISVPIIQIMNLRNHIMGEIRVAEPGIPPTPGNPIPKFHAGLQCLNVGHFVTDFPLPIIRRLGNFRVAELVNTFHCLLSCA
jgi:hypothetical protein